MYSLLEAHPCPSLPQEIIKVAFDNGINMFDTAEGYANGKSEEEMYVDALMFSWSPCDPHRWIQGPSYQGIGTEAGGTRHLHEALLQCYG